MGECLSVARDVNSVPRGLESFGVMLELFNRRWDPDLDKMPGIVVASCSEFWYFRDQLNVALSRLLTEVVISSPWTQHCLWHGSVFHGVRWQCFGIELLADYRTEPTLRNLSGSQFLTGECICTTKEMWLDAASKITTVAPIASTVQIQYTCIALTVSAQRPKGDVVAFIIPRIRCFMFHNHGTNLFWFTHIYDTLCKVQTYSDWRKKNATEIMTVILWNKSFRIAYHYLLHLH
jgi:hypothetical protein